MGEQTRPAAVVTGASRGIGAAVALRLAAEGYAVVAAARSEPALARLAAHGAGNITPFVLDVGEDGAAELLAERADTLGRLGAWVNNAATLERTAFSDLTFERWREILRVDLDAVFCGCRAAFTAMRGSGGVIVNIASLSGVANVEKFPGLAAYNVAKAGVIALTEAVALEGREHGIRCVCISPGAVDTEMLRRAAPQLKPGMTPEQMAAIVSFVISDAGAPLSGTNIPLFTNR